MRGARVAKGILADKMFQLLQPNAFPISSRAHATVTGSEPMRRTSPAATSPTTARGASSNDIISTEPEKIRGIKCRVADTVQVLGAGPGY
jgi:hypothetical protein